MSLAQSDQFFAQNDEVMTVITHNRPLLIPSLNDCETGATSEIKSTNFRPSGNHQLG